MESKKSETSEVNSYYRAKGYLDGLPGGIPSRYCIVPQEAEEAINSAKKVIEIVEKKIMKGE